MRNFIGEDERQLQKSIDQSKSLAGLDQHTVSIYRSDQDYSCSSCLSARREKETESRI